MSGPSTRSGPVTAAGRVAALVPELTTLAARIQSVRPGPKATPEQVVRAWALDGSLLPVALLSQCSQRASGSAPWLGLACTGTVDGGNDEQAHEEDEQEHRGQQQ